MSAIAPADDAAIVQAVSDLGAAVRTLRENPRDPSIPRLYALLALDALAEARRRLAADMAKEMLSDGVESFESDMHRVTVCAGKTTTKCDPKSVPDDPKFWKRAPDTKAIRKHVEQNPSCNWAAIETGSPYVMIKPKG